ncbi:nitrous oxide reductase family maturation protein NosD [Stutzerimonas stutzeri]|uniref:nitrous oxide reductase family maturation protein NosD n=1 Tax=Stutzerimonas stutzeri TaxID=316 RepID=UPI00265A4538|nr:nitrous oxide reductase family maturation protein NosD [Stutzerimonas stutzeri]MCF6782716.1 nitrous oxide reductase family maturation protein NosD [Stutzerimonas stutzeri]MCF6805821.1 nitrous oxide reductase family maturation protein NosD [Stutzerimonas stutzeri]
MLGFQPTHKLQALALVALTISSGAAFAEPQPITALPLQAEGDNRWTLPSGEYSGQFLIDQPMTLSCAPGAVIRGEHQGNVLTVRAPNVTIEGCQLRDSGHDLTNMNAAIFLEPTANEAVIRDNHVLGQGFGILLESNRDVLIQGNRVEGNADLRSQDRGNGIHMVNANTARILDNHVRHTRDGVYLGNSNNNLIQGNLMEDLRFGIHYMFSQSNRVIGNTTRRTRTGYALMQSRMLTVENNRSEDDQNYGVLMNYITYSTIRNNFVSNVQRGQTGDDSMIKGGEGKALFIYNSLFNTIENNHFQGSNLGVHLTAGSEDNKISSNAFVGNEQQVKYVATRTQEWSVEGRGNYWSDYLGWDRDEDGLGDIPYEPNDNVDRLLWMYPQVRLLMNSPSIEVLRWVQRAFPVIKSPGVQDSHPLMKLPTEKLMNTTQEPSS